MTLARRYLRPVSTAMLVILAAESCVKWVVQTEPPSQAIEGNASHALRIRTADGRVVEVTQTSVVGDSVMGVSSDGRVAVPLADVRSVSVEKPDTKKMLIVVGAIGVGLGLLLLAAMNSVEQDVPIYLTPVWR